jgi:hypothetical protein
MATAKKKQVKVRDLKPSKDAKGGMARQDQNSSRTQNAGRFNKNQSSSKNLL